MDGDLHITTEGEILPPEQPDIATMVRDVLCMYPILFPPRPLSWYLEGFEDYLKRPIRPPDVQLKFPRSKKRRIQKKWRENPKNWGQIVYTLSKNPKAVLRRMELKREREKARRIHRDKERDAAQPEVGMCRVPPLLKG